MVVLGTGCIKPDYETCADGTICPDNLVCAPVAGCTTPAAIRACDGIAELAACVIDDGPGECRGETCVPASCGNGLVDLTLGEQCDDGNNIDGDGCSATCNSNETCGNGVVDFLKGEQCDDGNLVSLDGCSRTCRTEQLTSDQLGTAATVGPSAREYTAAVYDPARHVTVLFGGDTGTYQNDTWEYDGATWKQIATVAAPPRRHAHMMAYDTIRHRVLVYGGDGGAYLTDLWAYDGVTWTQLPGTGPGVRFTSMVFDSKRDRLVLFGGQFIADIPSATWEYDGTTWTSKLTPTLPSDRFGVGLVYDPVRDRTIMFGGIDRTTSATLAETWEYDGNDWKQITIASPPPARLSFGMAFDTTTHEAVMTGGAPAQSTTYRYNGTTWTLVNTTTTLPPRFGLAYAYDSARQRTIVFGGGGNGPLLADTWELGSDWQAPVPAAPVGRDGQVMGYDPLRGRVVLFGGHDATQSDNAETWEFDGTNWLQRTPATSPGPRWGGRLAYDPVRKHLVLFGGSHGTGTFPNGNATGSRTLLNDTWAWDGTTWTQLAPTTSPTARMTPAMAWDDDGQRIVMHGGWIGTASSGSNVDDTWSFDGSDWTDISSTVRPPGRYGHGMVYDAAGHRLVIFAGWTDNGGGMPLADTWQLVGSTWTQLTTPAAPFARGDVQMVYDTVGERVLVIGGTAILGQGFNAYSDMWELRGSTWDQLEPGELPSARAISSIAYDSIHARAVIYGGIHNDELLADTWTVGFDPVVAAEVCASGLDLDGDTLVGCADPDCADVCSPLCTPSDAPPTATCTAAADGGCGDGVCTVLENCRLCPSDCGACTAVCGDSYCDPGETATTCPGDCD